MKTSLIEKIRQLKAGEIEFEDLSDAEVKEAFEKRYLQIRKLTPRECFRLMDVDESNIDRMMASDGKGDQIISNSQLYKMAGNSIIVAVLEGVFRNMFFGAENQQEKDGQGRLF